MRAGGSGWEQAPASDSRAFTVAAAQVLAIAPAYAREYTASGAHPHAHGVALQHRQRDLECEY